MDWIMMMVYVRNIEISEQRKRPIKGTKDELIAYHFGRFHPGPPLFPPVQLFSHAATLHFLSSNAFLRQMNGNGFSTIHCRYINAVCVFKYIVSSRWRCRLEVVVSIVPKIRSMIAVSFFFLLGIIFAMDRQPISAPCAETRSNGKDEKGCRWTRIL